MYTARCLCGGIRLSIKGELQPIQLCYCTQCRRAQGNPFASVIPVKADDVSFDSGEELLQHYESSPGKERAFCRQCGSPVYSRRTAMPEMLRLRAGLIDQDIPVTLARHAFVTDKANWWTIHDDLPQYPEAAP
ncbi:MAG: GFA family protein [Rhizobiaceae bacterium]|nr:MAG: GFA family protein [Rhizobiaceae bacterium]